MAVLLVLVVLLSAGSGFYAGASFFPQQAPNVTITTTIFTATTTWTTSTIWSTVTSVVFGVWTTVQYTTSTSTVTITGPQTFTQEIGGTAGGHVAQWNGYLRSYAFAPTTSGTIWKIGLNIYAAAGNVRLAIYDDSGNAPKNLLGQTDSVAASGTGWQDVTITKDASGNPISGVQVGSGKQYWVALQCDSSTLSLPFVRAGTERYRSWTYGAFPATFGTASVYAETPSIRLTYHV